VRKLSADEPEELLVRALEDNLLELWSHFGRGPGCALHDEAGAVWFDTPIPVLPYHSVLRFRAEEDVDARIDAILEHFRARNVEFLWMVHPSARPEDLAERLLARGLAEIDDCPGMVADLAQLAEPGPTPEGFEIHEATSESDAADALDLVAWRWNLPPEHLPHLFRLNEEFRIGEPDASVRIWLAWKDGEPVAKAVLHLAAGAAGLYGVATKPEARGSGLAQVLTLHVFRAARAAGFELGLLHSSPMAVRLYERIGFRKVTEFRLFAPSADLHV